MVTSSCGHFFIYEEIVEIPSPWLCESCVLYAHKYIGPHDIDSLPKYV